MFRKGLLGAALIAGVACLFATSEAKADPYYYYGPGFYSSGYHYGPGYHGTYYRGGYHSNYYGPAYYPTVRYHRFDDDTPYYGAPVRVKLDKNYYRSRWDPRYQPRWEFDDGRWELEYKKVD